jgi:hypothetical protein
MADQRVCPVSGGAHRYAPDEAGVSMCACGVVEMSPQEQLDLIEIQTQPPLPAGRAARLYGRLYDVLSRADPEGVAERLGGREDFVQERVDSTDRPDR